MPRLLMIDFVLLRFVEAAQSLAHLRDEMVHVEVCHARGQVPDRVGEDHHHVPKHHAVITLAKATVDLDKIVALVIIKSKLDLFAISVWCFFSLRVVW